MLVGKDDYGATFGLNGTRSTDYTDLPGGLEMVDNFLILVLTVVLLFVTLWSMAEIRITTRKRR